MYDTFSITDQHSLDIIAIVRTIALEEGAVLEGPLKYNWNQIRTLEGQRQVRACPSVQILQVWDQPVMELVVLVVGSRQF